MNVSDLSIVAKLAVFDVCEVSDYASAEISVTYLFQYPVEGSLTFCCSLWNHPKCVPVSSSRPT